jgi:hypothetical protein
MYAVFQSEPKKWSNLSDAHNVTLEREAKIILAEEVIDLTSDYVDKILFADIQKLSTGKHSLKPNKINNNTYNYYKVRKWLK